MTPANRCRAQYLNDFCGSVAVEEDDGRFLEERRGCRTATCTAIKNVRTATAERSTTRTRRSTDGQKRFEFPPHLRRASPTEAWWRTNLNLQAYYSYQAIIQASINTTSPTGISYDPERAPTTAPGK